MTPINRRIVLARRPQGAPVDEDFRLETVAVPELAEGQVLVRTRFLSLDPYMRGRMSDAPSYVPPVPIGGVMVGGTVGEVVTARSPGFAPGDVVEASSGWQEYAAAAPQTLRKLDGSAPPSTALGVLGMPGMTAYCGLKNIGQPKPGETVVVAAASGPVGSMVGQLARLWGARAVGSPAGPRNAPTSAAWASTLASTIATRPWRTSWRLPALRGSTFISRMSAGRCGMPCCRC